MLHSKYHRKTAGLLMAEIGEQYFTPICYFGNIPISKIRGHSVL